LKIEKKRKIDFIRINEATLKYNDGINLFTSQNQWFFTLLFYCLSFFERKETFLPVTVGSFA
jgi:hypothetical protein